MTKPKAVRAAEAQGALRFVELLEPDEQERAEILGHPEFWAKDYAHAMKQLASVMALDERAYKAEAELAAAREREQALRNALDLISRGEGRFSRDPLEHASNTIEDMKAIAVAALRATAEEPKERLAPLWSGDPPGSTCEGPKREYCAVCGHRGELHRGHIINVGGHSSCLYIDNEGPCECGGWPAAEPKVEHPFEPCRLWGSGHPDHNFTCALLCTTCGLPREYHPAADSEVKP